MLNVVRRIFQQVVDIVRLEESKDKPIYDVCTSSHTSVTYQ